MVFTPPPRQLLLSNDSLTPRAVLPDLRQSGGGGGGGAAIESGVTEGTVWAKADAEIASIPLAIMESKYGRIRKHRLSRQRNSERSNQGTSSATLGHCQKQSVVDANTQRAPVGEHLSHRPLIYVTA
jgi:hypothetical protein